MYTQISKKSILIGEQFTLNISITTPTKQFVNLIGIPDTLDGFEVVGRSAIDTIRKLDSNRYQQLITFTSFDSGRWVLPQFELTENIFTDSVEINVGYSKPDSTNVLRDIKPIIEPNEKKIKWHYYLIAALVLAFLNGAIVRSVINARKKKPTVFQAKISAIEEALQSINEIQSNKLTSAEEIKQYHTRLSDIFKNYLNRSYGNLAVGYTTSTILVSLSSHTKNVELISHTAAALRCNDAVKFAKYLPDIYQSNNCLEQIKNSIVKLEEEKKR